MNKHGKNAISPTRAEDYPKWYQQIIKEADLAESSPVRGCMVIKPWGYAIWENIQKQLDADIKATGHKNFYCPLFIPLSFLERESQQVKGFAKECAVVTHHKLGTDEKGNLIPQGKLEEPLIIRPTSETIIGDIFSRWIQSHRDLPLLLNQWANVVRWEMRTRMFLRTTEFLWQEGHTAHATKQEALDETLKMLDIYVKLAEDYLAMPVIKGKKTNQEKFPGAEITYCLEALMQDKKALQAGTSHFLGQNFSKSFDIKFSNNSGVEEFVWTTSWGVTTRLIGGLIMTHSDDDGLILPPKIAPLHIIIIPLLHKEESNSNIMEYCEQIKQEIEGKEFNNSPICVDIDNTINRPGNKIWSWIKKGVPIRLEIGKKELETNTVYMGRRDKAPKEKATLSKNEFTSTAANILNQIQNTLFERAKKLQVNNTKVIKSKDEFYEFFTSNKPNTGGFALAPWIDEPKSEKEIKDNLKVTPRCIPEHMKSENKENCIFTQQPNAPWTIFSKAY